MSKSFKKTPICKDRSPWAKRQANKKVRRFKKDLKSGKSYKKIYCSYDICDWLNRCSLERHLKFEECEIIYYKYGLFLKKEPFNKEKEIQEWKKFYYRK